jgi:hypothetical protein
MRELNELGGKIAGAGMASAYYNPSREILIFSDSDNEQIRNQPGHKIWPTRRKFGITLPPDQPAPSHQKYRSS